MFKFGIAVSAVLLIGSSAQAAAITYGGTSPGSMIDTGLHRTNFNASVAIPMFDRNLGTLLDVSFSLGGTIMSRIRIENVDDAPQTVVATAQGSITLTRPDGTTLVAVLPAQSVSDSLQVFDGTVDFAGPSGVDFGAVTGSIVDTSGILTDAADLSLFSAAGGGSLLLPVAARGQSRVAGSGNITSAIQTQGEGSVQVTYDYAASPARSTDVPEPATLALLGMGALGTGLLRRSRSARPS